jgi:hypothetical protein
MNYTDIKEKSYYYSLRVIDNIEDLRLFLQMISVKPNCIWRGVNNAKYSNYNSLQIHNLKDNGLNSVNDVISYIDRLDKAFDKWNDGLFIKYFKNYNINEIPIFSKLSILRHYGVPTPILDWSRNPFVSLFFATNLDNSQPEFISLYCITPDHPYYKFDFKTGICDEVKKFQTYQKGLQNRLSFMSKHGDSEILKQSEINFHKEFCQNVFTKTDHIYGTLEKFPINRIEDSFNDDFKFFINNNYNITAQSGLFIINCYPYLPLEKAIFERNKELTKDETNRQIGMQRCKDNFLCFDISVDLINEILNFLNEKGINQSSIYPDLNRLKYDII